jgi:hypothetical protein
MNTVALCFNSAPTQVRGQQQNPSEMIAVLVKQLMVAATARLLLF